MFVFILETLKEHNFLKICQILAVGQVILALLLKVK